MILGYAGCWDARSRAPHKPLELATARERHNRGEPYAAVFSDETLGPRVIVDVWTTNEFVNVTFLDDLKRILTTFTFSPEGLHLVRDSSPRPKKRPDIRAPDGLYFLQTIIHTDEYDGDTNNALMATSYNYEQSGFLRIVNECLVTREATEFEMQVDVSAHWEPGPPAFGAYDGYLVYGRWAPPKSAPVSGASQPT